MTSSNDLEILIVILGAAFLVVGSYIFYHPLSVIKLISRFHQRNIKNDEQILSGYKPPKIQVKFNLSPNEQSQLLNTMKNLLENLINDHPKMNSNLEEQLEITFVPEDDEEDPDLTHDDEGPEVSEVKEPQEENFVRLGDFMKKEL